MRCACLLVALGAASPAFAQTAYDLLVKGGHVIDGRNGIDAVSDVAIKDGKIAAVAPGIPVSQAAKVIDASGLSVMPGLVDIHVHAYTGEGESYSRGFRSVPPDGFTLESCTTTVADAGTAGWRNFEDFKKRIIDRVQDSCDRLPQHRRPRHGGGQLRAGPRGHGGKADGRDGTEVQGCDRRHQERALQRAGMETVQADRWRRDDCRHPGHGGLRQRPGAHDCGALHQVPSAPATSTRMPTRGVAAESSSTAR